LWQLSQFDDLHLGPVVQSFLFRLHYPYNGLSFISGARTVQLVGFAFVRRDSANHASMLALAVSSVLAV
jgi:hypothetical protein